MSSSVRLSKWGNSIGVRLPKSVVDALGLEPGGVLDVSLDGNRIVFRPAEKFHLDDLVSKITDENRPGETEWGTDEGKECWE